MTGGETMGRTLPPFSQLIENERQAWAPFRRALRQEDQVLFDQLFDCVKLHVQAGVYLSRPWPFEVLAMAMLLQHHKRLEQLLARLDAHGQLAIPPAAPALDAPPAPRALPRPMTLPLLWLDAGGRAGETPASPESGGG
jgi:hypothetical protein